ncbi:MAG: alpha/beta hydrolase [Fischerella sp.]|nr:alpha/beta hydrolase [Fischerella sp.]
MSVKLVYIHGANATSESFTYIRDKVQGFEEVIIDYSCFDSFKNNLSKMIDVLKKHTGSFFFIAHSLGGIYSLHLAEKFSDQVSGAVTLSTPYKGNIAADVVSKIMPHVAYLKDVGTRSEPIIEAANIPVRWDWTNVVTTRGNCLWLRQPNDGVVTIESQRRPDIKQIDLPLNHYEVVVSRNTVNIILENLKKIS